MPRSICSKVAGFITSVAVPHDSGWFLTSHLGQIEGRFAVSDSSQSLAGGAERCQVPQRHPGRWNQLHIASGVFRKSFGWRHPQVVNDLTAVDGDVSVSAWWCLGCIEPSRKAARHHQRRHPMRERHKLRLVDDEVGLFKSFATRCPTACVDNVIARLKVLGVDLAAWKNPVARKGAFGVALHHQYLRPGVAVAECQNRGCRCGRVRSIMLIHPCTETFRK